MKSKILVIGSSNTDMVVRTKHFPSPGETVLGGTFFMNPGGKGANQAVASARLGGNVTFITKLGNDIFGKQALEQFKKEGINTDYVLSDTDLPSGVALITVDDKGENSIVVAPGSNGSLSSTDLTKASKEFESCSLVLMQLEIPLSTVSHAAQIAVETKKRVILNPAPAAKLPNDLLRSLFLLTPNRSEAESLTGIAIRDEQSLKDAAQKLKAQGVENIIITLADQGAYLYTGSISKLLAAPKVAAIDSTAAGDVFNGALAVAIAEGESIDRAIIFANHAAAISVTRVGAQASAPYRNEVIPYESK
jgi:ribokinase